MVDLLLTGLSLDKRQLNGVLSSVARDVHLCELVTQRHGDGDGSPYEIWNLFTSNLSDAQTASALHALRRSRPRKWWKRGRGTRPSLAFAFCGIPYYDVHYVDSLFIAGAGADAARESAFACAAQGIERNSNPRRVSSEVGFGVLALSSFFHSAYQRKNGPDSAGVSAQYRTAPLVIGVPESGGLVETISRECVELSARPESVKFGGAAESDLRIVGLLLVEQKEHDGSPKLSALGDCAEQNAVRMPFKRFVAFPRGDQSAYLPRMPSLASAEVVRVFAIGGLEHNLGALHLITRHKWDKCPGDIHIGENRFDLDASDMIESKDGTKIDLFCEGYVTTCNADWRERRTHPNCAEVYRLDLKYKSQKVQFFGINGFSAPMSRISFLRLVAALDSNDPGQEQFIPDRFQTCLYTLPNVGNLDRHEWFAQDPLLRQWDAMDVMNNPSEAMEILEKIDPEPC